jgi:hypothetical protein
MASDDFRPRFQGEPPEPPAGTPTEVSRAAWKMAWRAEQIAIGADNRSLALFEGLGELASKFTTEMMERFDKVDEHLDRVDARLDKEIGPKLKSAEDNAKEARTSSHDLQDEVAKMENILANIKEKTIDSVRVKQLVVEEHEVLVTRQELDRLQKQEAAAIAANKQREDERRSYKMNTKSLIVGSIIAGVILMFATYAFTRVTNPAPATVVAPSHP